MRDELRRQPLWLAVLMAVIPVSVAPVVAVSAAPVIPVSVTTVIAISLAVPMVVVFNPTAIPAPIPEKKLLPVVMGPDPAGALVRRSSPVAIMPCVTAPHGIPIAVDPNEVGVRSRGLHSNHSRFRWRANSDSNRDLRTDCRFNGQQHQCKHDDRPSETPHVGSPHRNC